MLISLRPPKLVINFAYNPAVVAIIKTLPGRLFEPKLKCWTVPDDYFDEVLNTLIPLGFKLAPDVETFVAKSNEQRMKIKTLLTNPKLYDGKLPLFDFQRIGAMWLREKTGALLADVPGLGKSIQTIGALQQTPNTNRVVVFCPASLKFSWQNEIKKWAPEESVIVVNGKKSEREDQWQTKARWHIANYELLIHDYDEIKNLGVWDAIVCDEATRISNPKAVSVRALKTLSGRKRIALTGTPISNSPIDLWNIIDWIRPGFLGSLYSFKFDYTVCDLYGNILSYRNLDKLAARLAPLVLRRTKEEVFTDFPPKIYEEIYFDLSPEERKVYESVKAAITAEVRPYLTGVETASLGIVPVKMLRLKQITDHLLLVGDGSSRHYLDSSKLETCLDLLKPIVASNEKTIVFTQFAEMAKILKEAFRQFDLQTDTPIVMGEVDTIKRQVAVDKFTSDPDCRIIIMTEAGAYGLNLQAASYVIHYDAPWSIAKLMQREDRAHRIGQKKSVTVYHLIAKNTIDEYVAKVLHQKQKISVNVLGDDDRLEKMGLTEEDIKAILRI